MLLLVLVLAIMGLLFMLEVCLHFMLHFAHTRGNVHGGFRRIALWRTRRGHQQQEVLNAHALVAMLGLYEAEPAEQRFVGVVGYWGFVWFNGVGVMHEIGSHQV